MNNHKISTVVFSQGWLDGQFENAVARAAEKANEDPTASLIASQVQDQWNIVSSALDELLRENADLRRQLANVKSALE